jgi:uncharacterized protein (DUF1800 family)
MGQYLNMRGNVAPTAPLFQAPNENYAREVLQLFTIGLNFLQPDGTLKLGTDGLPVPTYDQTTIQNFAKVFTGWNTDPTAVKIPTSQPAPATQPVIVNSFYNKPMVVTASKHSNAQKILLSYPSYFGRSPANVIDAVSKSTTSSSNVELDRALQNIFNHPNVGPFIARRLIQRLVCSNPSPAYVYRVASVFNDDGSYDHIRGNMQAVIQAILTDYEARTTDLLGNLGYGHLREPVIRATNVIRAFHPTSVSGYFKISRTDTQLGQTALRAPTVFNFYEPNYVQPGEIANAGLFSPELQIVSETTSVSSLNFIYTGIYSSNGWLGNDVKLDLTTERSLASDPSALLDRLNLLLMAGQMPADMKQRVVTYVSSLSATDTLARARAAVHLVATSSQFTAEK